MTVRSGNNSVLDEIRLVNVNAEIHRLAVLEEVDRLEHFAMQHIHDDSVRTAAAWLVKRQQTSARQNNRSSTSTGIGN